MGRNTSDDNAKLSTLGEVQPKANNFYAHLARTLKSFSDAQILHREIISAF